MNKTNTEKRKGQGSSKHPKILSLRKIISLTLPYQTKKILVTGSFDIIHSEHKKFLKKAKKLGGCLFVGLESDKRIRQLKGKNRPINSLDIRLKNIAWLSYVDYTFPLPLTFSTPKEHEVLIRRLKPDILAVSSHTLYLKEKRTILKKYHLQLKIVHRHNPAISTTKIIQSL